MGFLFFSGALRMVRRFRLSANMHNRSRPCIRRAAEKQNSAFTVIFYKRATPPGFARTYSTETVEQPD